MKTLIAYVSTHHRNTHILARSMAAHIGADTIDLLADGGPSKEEILSYDLLGLGSGIYALRHHRALLRFAASLPRERAGKCFVFSTRGFGRPDLYHRALHRKIRRRGWEVLGDFSCRGFDTFGPLAILGGINRGRPDGEDLQRARDFLRSIVDEAAQRSERSTR